MAASDGKAPVAAWFLHMDDALPESEVFDNWLDGAMHVQEVLRNEHPAYKSAHFFLLQPEERVAEAEGQEPVAPAAAASLVQFSEEAAPGDAVLAQSEPVAMALELGHAASVRALVTATASAPLAEREFAEGDVALLCVGEGAADAQEAVTSAAAWGRTSARAYRSPSSLSAGQDSVLLVRLAAPSASEVGLALGAMRTAAPRAAAGAYAARYSFSRRGPPVGIAMAEASGKTTSIVGPGGGEAPGPMKEVD